MSAKADTRTPKEESDFNILSNFYSHRMGPREHDGDVPPTAGYIEIRAALKALEDKATEAEQKGNKFALGRIRAKIEGWKGLLQKEADIARAKLDGPPEAVNPMSAFKRKMMQRRRAMKMSNAIGEGEE